MEEQHYTVIVYEHLDKYGRFLAYEIYLTGRRPLWWPTKPERSETRERLLLTTRAANPQPERWNEKVAA
jgi:hypothetical protein